MGIQCCFRLSAARHMILLAMVVLVAGCSPEDKPKEAGSGTRKRTFPLLQELKVEVRDDGLAYTPGAATPFTGDSIELHYNRTPPRLSVRTPYLRGKKHGVKTTYSSGGKLREER